MLAYQKCLQESGINDRPDVRYSTRVTWDTMIWAFNWFLTAQVSIVMAPYLEDSLSVILNKFRHILMPADIFNASNELLRLGSIDDNHHKAFNILGWTFHESQLRRSNRMVDNDLKKDFITDNFGLVGIIFRSIIALEHFHNHDEQQESRNFLEVCDLETMRRTKTILRQICSRSYNIRLQTGQRTRKYSQVFKDIFLHWFWISDELDRQELQYNSLSAKSSKHYAHNGLRAQIIDES